MPRAALTIALILTIAASGLLSGCSTNLTNAIANVSTASLKGTTAPALSVNGDLPSYNGTPIAIYTSIARGANSCWLGPTRPLHGTHLFRASVSSDIKQGEPSIVIYERDKSTSPEKRIAAMRINIKSVSTSQSAITVINRRFAVPVAQRMIVDVQRWAAGKLTCASIADNAIAPDAANADSAASATSTAKLAGSSTPATARAKAKSKTKAKSKAKPKLR